MGGKKTTIKADELQHERGVTQTLFDIATAVNTTSSMKDLYRAIHTALGRVMDVTNFFIAIVNTTEKTLYFPYFEDVEDDDFAPITDFDPHFSLTGLVVAKQVPVLLKKAELQKRALKKGVWGPVPLIWMGVPLRVKGKILGAIAVQNYTDPDCYAQKDLSLLASVSDQIAVAIERKQAEEELKRTETKFTKLFQTTPCWCLLSTVNEGRIIEANDTFFLSSGYERTEVIGHNGFEFGLFVNADDRGKVLEEFNKNGRVHDFPIQFRLKNGKVRDFLWSAQPLDNDDELCWLSAVLDITERNRAQEEINQANRLAAEQEKHALVGRVAGKMAHDFNNILGVIMGNTELALLDCKDTEIKKTLELICGQTIRGKNLTKNLTAFAKIQEPKHENFLINDTIDIVVDLLKKDLEDIELHKKYQQGLPELIADQGMIEHALVNLLQNSIHALSKARHPKIIIRTSYTDRHICFEIEDNGCGIPQANLSDIFEPSFTLKGSNDLTCSYSREIKGTGYGMSNVKRYIEQHKGKILVTSDVGAGTIFLVRLPLIGKMLTQHEKSELGKSCLIKGKYILLVEDEPAISDVQYRILTHEPCRHRVDLAMNGQMAIDLFNRNNYDLVSLDYQLPGKINGMDVYQEIRAQNGTVPVLFISGNLEFLESIHQLKKEHKIDHLSKPCQNKVYISTINQLLGN